MNWINGDGGRQVFVLWLYGSAGSGKTALSQSIAELCEAQGLLAATFFFSKDTGERSNSGQFASTLAYQIALSTPNARPHIEDAIRQDPSLFGKALQTQMRALVTKPVRNAFKGTASQPHTGGLVIIDALDECHDAKAQRYILDIISEEFHPEGPLPLIFLITSRPEESIQARFSTGNLARLSRHLSLENYLESRNDIQTFLEAKFNEIKEQHPLRGYIPPTWPSDETLGEILTRSSGQFVYATTVIDYVSSLYHRPTDRLNIVLGLLNHNGDPPFAELDALYSHILSSVVYLKQALRIVGVILLMSIPLSSENVEELLFLRPGDVQLFLGGMSSLINYRDPHKPISVLHAPLSDFLFDPGHVFVIFSSRRELGVPLLVEYAIYHFDAHFDLASFTNQLYEELLSFDLPSVCRNMPSMEDTWYFVPNLLDCIRNTVIFHDAEDIYQAQRSLLDGYLDTELTKYDTDDRLADLVALLPMYSSPVAVKGLDDISAFKDLLLGLKDGEDLLSVDESSLNLRHMVRRHSQGEPYVELLCTYVQDFKRSGRHFLTGQRYALAARRCLDWIKDYNEIESDEPSDDELALPWIFECIPSLLLRAVVDEDLELALRQLSSPNSISYHFHPKLIQNLEHSSLAYSIETKFKSDYEHMKSHSASFKIVPQGLKLYSVHRLSIPGINPTSGVCPENNLGLENLQDNFCCVFHLIVWYTNHRRRGQLLRDLDGKESLIISVDDPFPEIDNEDLTPSTTMIEEATTVDGLMRVIIYRFWARAMDFK
ncbi:hypothetical protein D9613_007995 [Agrocybe pediades]|uniref:NACHT domain-containing protein n=1 Tax=Agrocybe pediades TaxID=84607 RepID=A0A8H4QP25_9AGAR|nr:hypothetical protein D9613_007995 [Agrocybe pediades]